MITRILLFPLYVTLGAVCYLSLLLVGVALILWWVGREITFYLKSRMVEKYRVSRS